jgi:hypothetical protein
MPRYFQSAHLEARHPFAISSVIEGGTAKTISSWERDLETQASANYVYASRLRTRVTAGTERKIWRSDSRSGNEFASCIIVARLRFRCRFDILRCIFDIGQSHALCPYSNAMRGNVSVRLVFADLQSPVSSRGACVLGP